MLYAHFSCSYTSTTKTSIVFQPPLQGCGRSLRKDSCGCLSTPLFPHCSCFFQVRKPLSFLNLYYIVCRISINPCAYDRWYFTAYIVYLTKLSVNDIYPIGGGNLKNSNIGLILLLYIVTKLNYSHSWKMGSCHHIGKRRIFVCRRDCRSASVLRHWDSVLFFAYPLGCVNLLILIFNH